MFGKSVKKTGRMIKIKPLLLTENPADTHEKPAKHKKGGKAEESTKEASGKKESGRKRKKNKKKKGKDKDEGIVTLQDFLQLFSLRKWGKISV